MILGIDPGSRLTGFGVVKSEGTRLRYVVSGCVRAGKGDFKDRLLSIHDALIEIIARYQPDEVAIEQVFMHKYADAALKLGHARGVAVLAVAKNALDLSEYSPRQIKQAIAGYGGADKQQVQHMVKLLLGLSDLPQVDAADALAIAICHANSRKTIGNVSSV